MKTAEIKATNDCHFNGHHFRKEVACIVQAAFETAPETTDGVLWITSANDKEHSAQSLHYENRAFDFRTKNIVGYTGNSLTDSKVIAWRYKIKVLLGEDYDVVVENNHLHVELDPKG